MRKVCKTCKMFIDGDTCPAGNNGSDCGLNNPSKLSENWKGRIYIFDTKKSLIAQRAGYKHEGEYAIKVR